MSVCNKYLDYQGELGPPPPPHEYALKLFRTFNDKRNQAGLSVFEWNDALYRTAYRTVKHNSKTGNTNEYDRSSFDSMPDQMRFYGYYNGDNYRTKYLGLRKTSKPSDAYRMLGTWVRNKFTVHRDAAAAYYDGSWMVILSYGNTCPSEDLVPVDDVLDVEDANVEEGEVEEGEVVEDEVENAEVSKPTPTTSCTPRCRSPDDVLRALLPYVLRLRELELEAWPEAYCDVITAYIYEMQLLQGNPLKVRPACGRVEKKNHWWLKAGDLNIDFTASQFCSLRPFIRTVEGNPVLFGPDQHLLNAGYVFVPCDSSWKNHLSETGVELQIGGDFCGLSFDP